MTATSTKWADIPNVVAAPTKWSVLLLRPDYSTDHYGTDTYLALVEAPTARAALTKARNQLIKASGDVADIEDYYCLLCVRGHINDYSDGNGNVKQPKKKSMKHENIKAIRNM